MNKKMTKKMAIEVAIDALNGKEVSDISEVIEKLQTMISQLDKRNASPKKLTATQQKNLELRDAIVDFLSVEIGMRFTCSELSKRVPDLDGMTPQKISALMSALVETGRVSKEFEKRTAYFFIAGES